MKLITSRVNRLLSAAPTTLQCPKILTQLSSKYNHSTATSTQQLPDEQLQFDIINAIPQSTLDFYHENGYCVIDEFLTASEVEEIEDTYDKFMRGEMNIPGNDFCDMATSDGNRKSLDDMIMVNAMLPRVYYPQWKNNIYERKSRALMKRLFISKEMNIDYDQLLAKRPQQKEAIFAFHQDTAYWPDLQGRDSSTATCSLAIDATTIPNGCIAFLGKSHLEPELREFSRK